MNCEVIDIIIGGFRYEIIAIENGTRRIIKFPYEGGDEVECNATI